MNNVSGFLIKNTAHPLQEQVNLALEKGNKTRVALYKGLSFVAASKEKGEFIFRAQKNGIRSQLKIGSYKEHCSNDDIIKGKLDVSHAILVAQKVQKKATLGLHPVKELKSNKYSTGTTMDDIFQKLLVIKKSRVKSTEAFERQYKNEVSPFIGEYAISQLDQNDVQSVLNTVLASGRKSVAEKALYLIKNLFDYASSNNICINITQKMTVKENAGGVSPPTGIDLADHDLRRTFSLMRKHESTFQHRLYLFIILLVSLGTRKCELIKSRWVDFDQDARLLHIEREISKTKVAVAVPISIHLQPIIDELWELADGSDYLFPSFKSSRNGHMCANTPNSALERLFNKAENESGLTRIQRFTIHDLRRTFRTMLSRMNIPMDICELCINHRESKNGEITKGSRYDRYIKLKARREAHDKLAEKIMQLIEEEEVDFKQLKLVA
mgnify:CR=1 FL=1